MNKYSKAVLSGLSAATLVGVSLALAPAANAASLVAAPVGSDKPIYVLDADTGDQALENASYHWNDDFIFSPNPHDQNAVFTAPTGVVAEYEFISPRGSEHTKAAWNAFVKIGASGNIGAFDGIVSGLASTNAAATPGSTVGVANTGGDYALGIAYVNNAGVVVEADYVNVTFVGNAVPQNATFTFSGGASSSVAPAITTQPADQTVTSGASASFTVAASGTPAPTIKWQSKSGSGNWADVSGATAATLTVANTTVAQSGTQYRAVASNGTAPDATSNAATLTVNAPAPTAPTQPTGSDAGRATIAAPAKTDTTITVPAGIANAGTKYDAWAWSTPTKVGSQLTADASGNVVVDISSLPAGSHTVALTLPGDANYVVKFWGTFEKLTNTGDAISKDVALTANVTAADLWSLNAENTAIDFGNVARGAQSTKALGKVTVVDDRNVLKGWDLNATWADFDGAKNIGKGVLTVAPKAAAGYTPVAGISVSAVAGTAGAKKIADSTAGVTTTATGALFDADLTFKAPVNATAGAYHSTLTLTLTSK